LSKQGLKVLVSSVAHLAGAHQNRQPSSGWGTRPSLHF